MNEQPLSFQEIYSKYSGVVYARCKSFTRNSMDAQDLTHDVFVRILKNYDKFRGDSTLFTWIYRITTNICIDFIKKRPGAVLPLDMLEINPSDQPSQDPTTHSSIFVRELLQKFNTKIRKLAVLCLIEGLTHDEAADVMKMSSKTVGRKISALKIILEKKLKQEGFQYHV